MYDYRKLSESEKATVKRLRIERGYPLHAPPHPTHERGYFLITAAIFEHKHVMISPERRTDFELRLLSALDRAGCSVPAWVVLPNHYHVMLGTTDFTLIPQVMKLLHGRTSREWNLEDGTTGRKVWFHYGDRKIRGERHFFATFNYIHHNPVKHGYSETEAEWIWSSFALYLKDRGQDWILETHKTYPTLDYGQGWDD